MGKKSITDCFSHFCSDNLNEGFIEEQVEPALIKRVMYWGAEVGHDVLNVTRKGEQNQRHQDLMKEIKENF